MFQEKSIFYQIQKDFELYLKSKNIQPKNYQDFIKQAKSFYDSHFDEDENWNILTLYPIQKIELINEWYDLILLDSFQKENTIFCNCCWQSWIKVIENKTDIPLYICSMCRDNFNKNDNRKYVNDRWFSIGDIYDAWN